MRHKRHKANRQLHTPLRSPQVGRQPPSREVLKGGEASCGERFAGGEWVFGGRFSPRIFAGPFGSLLRVCGCPTQGPQKVKSNRVPPSYTSPNSSTPAYRYLRPATCCTGADQNCYHLYVMTQELSIKVEAHPPPRPKREPPPAPPSTEYPFNLIPVGGAARFPRAAQTVRNKLVEYRRRPGNENQKFTIRAITPHMCRVWRTA